MRRSARAVLVRLDGYVWDSLEEMVAEGRCRSVDAAIEFAAIRLVHDRKFRGEADAASTPEATQPLQDGPESDEED